MVHRCILYGEEDVHVHCVQHGWAEISNDSKHVNDALLGSSMRVAFHRIIYQENKEQPKKSRTAS